MMVVFYFERQSINSKIKDYEYFLSWALPALPQTYRSASKYLAQILILWPCKYFIFNHSPIFVPGYSSNQVSCPKCACLHYQQERIGKH